MPMTPKLSDRNIQASHLNCYIILGVTTLVVTVASVLYNHSRKTIGLTVSTNKTKRLYVFPFHGKKILWRLMSVLTVWSSVVPTLKHLSTLHMAASPVIDGFTHSQFQMEPQRIGGVPYGSFITPLKLVISPLIDPLCICAPSRWLWNLRNSLSFFESDLFNCSFTK